MGQALDQDGTECAKTLLSLADLLPGQSALVEKVASDDAMFRQRLHSMGIVRGTEVRVDHTAPLGDPKVYTVRGYLLTLRNAEAQQVVVKMA